MNIEMEKRRNKRKRIKGKKGNWIPRCWKMESKKRRKGECCNYVTQPFIKSDSPDPHLVSLALVNHAHIDRRDLLLQPVGKSNRKSEKLEEKGN